MFESDKYELDSKQFIDMDCLISKGLQVTEVNMGIHLCWYILQEIKVTSYFLLILLT